jgi:hypothetical protein
MILELINLIKMLIQYDSYYHTAKRVYDVGRYSGGFGVAMIEYGRQRSCEVIWPRNTPTGYMEEIIKIDPNYFNPQGSKKPSLL